MTEAPYIDPQWAPPQPPKARGHRRRALAWVVIGQLVASAVAGALWLAWSPSTIAYVLAGSAGQKLIIPTESEDQIAGAGRFAVLTLALGLIVGVLAWWLVRDRAATVLGVLAVSSIAGSLLVRAVGGALSSGQSTGAVQTIIHPPLQLHGWPWLGLQAFAAVISYLFLVVVSPDPLEDPHQPRPPHAMSSPA